jgi:hexokinase
VWSELNLSLDQLEEVRAALRIRIREGLAEDGREIKALPAYLPPPPPALEGRALVMDVGGTNMRAALIELSEGEARVVSGPRSRRFEARSADKTLSGEEFFDLQAKLICDLEPPGGLPVGYCFSYPSQVHASRDATLIRWTKGIEVRGVEGTLVGSRLGRALDRAGLSPGRVSVLNDTVASMLGGAYVFPGDHEKVIGLIAGTGTNMSGFFSGRNAPKLPESDPIAINLESGNFHPPHLTRFDEELDRDMTPSGAQRFEKAVSGYYLPYLFKRILPLHGLDPGGGSATLVSLRGQGGEPGDVAASLLRRSADLVAAGLAAVADHYSGHDEIGILAEGSLFWGDPEYAPRVETTLGALLAGRRIARILHLENANLVGAACAALYD